MAMLDAWVTSGRAIDFVLAVLFVEAAILLWRRRGRAVDILIGLAPGALLLLALRAALAGGSAAAILIPLALALPAHLADVARRRW